MRSLKLVLLAASIGLSGLSAIPCWAQFGSARILQSRAAESAERLKTTELVLGPAAFIGVNEKQGVVRSNIVTVIALEHGIDLGKKSKQFLQVGGFHYVKGSQYLTQLTGKYFVNRTLGVQTAYQWGSGGGNAFTVHGLFNLSSSTKDPAAKVPWDLQLGVGVLTPDKGPDAFSTFLQLSVGLGHDFSLDTSYWGVFPGGSNSINRFMVGIGYRF